MIILGGINKDIALTVQLIVWEFI